MGSRAARQPKPQPRSPEPATSTRPRGSRTLLLWLGVSSVVPLFIILILFFADIRFGQGFFAFRYSPIVPWRLMQTVTLSIFVAAACGAVWLLAHAGQREAGQRRAGGVILLLAMAGAGVWGWSAPPEHLNQHAFNMTSLSSDGAFVYEAMDIASIGEYLRDFSTVTLTKTPKQMGGTRVLSNPPLTTALAYATRRALDQPVDTPGSVEAMLLRDLGLRPREIPPIANGLRVSVILTVIWVLGGWAGYGLGRVFLSPAGAAVFALVVMFNPCTVHFIPGKDPGQLLTINAMLWAWFAAWRRRSVLLAVLGGAVLVFGSMVGLVHIWVALIALLATAWASWRKPGGLRTIALNSIGAAVGGVVVCAIAYGIWRWNIPATMLAVSRKWTELQGTFDMKRAVWYAIGLPIFLLFLSPAFWALLGLRLRRRRRLGFGAKLTTCTVAVMALIYGPLGLTYELPRLWVAFLPLLALGPAIDLPLLRATGRTLHPRAARALVWIVAVNVVFTAIHWTIFDVRESEYRLTSNRFYN